MSVAYPKFWLIKDDCIVGITLNGHERLTSAAVECDSVFVTILPSLIYAQQEKAMFETLLYLHFALKIW